MQKSGCFLKIGHEKSNLRCPCSIPEDMPIDLRVIACRSKVAPYGGVINAALQPRGEVLEIAAFLANVLGEIFGAIVLALVALLEIFERAFIPIAQISLVSLAAFLAKGGIFFDFIERAFAHAAFTIPLFGEVLVILEHEFRLDFVSVQAVAKLHEIVVGFKGGQINPHAVETAVVVLGIGATIDCRIAVLIVCSVFADFVLR